MITMVTFDILLSNKMVILSRASIWYQFFSIDTLPKTLSIVSIDNFDTVCQVKNLVIFMFKASTVSSLRVDLSLVTILPLLRNIHCIRRYHVTQTIRIYKVHSNSYSANFGWISMKLWVNFNHTMWYSITFGRKVYQIFERKLTCHYFLSECDNVIR
jgi:hypothetical protein